MKELKSDQNIRNDNLAKYMLYIYNRIKNIDPHIFSECGKDDPIITELDIIQSLIDDGFKYRQLLIAKPKSLAEAICYHADIIKETFGTSTPEPQIEKVVVCPDCGLEATRSLATDLLDINAWRDFCPNCFKIIRTSQSAPKERKLHQTPPKRMVQNDKEKK